MAVYVASIDGLICVRKRKTSISPKHSSCRHYERLILVLQREMRAELRRLEKERKEQEELVETLRDKIASQTVSQTPFYKRVTGMLYMRW